MGNAANLYLNTLGGPMGTACVMLFLFSAFFLGLWWRDREPGIQWVGLALLLAGSFYAFDLAGLLPKPSAHIGPIWAASILEISVLLQVVGLSMYVDPPSWHRRPWTRVAAAPMVLMLALHLLQVPIPRVWGNVLFVLPPFTLALMVWQARGTEPRAGYGLLAASLMVLPLALSVLIALRVDVVLLRYAGALSRILAALTLLVVCLHRRRMRLEAVLAERERARRDLLALNATLEQKVAERTADLESMVAGLEGFSRNVSHDLRGPLGGIAGLAQFANIAVGEGRTDKAREMIALIEREALKGTELVSALLELARVSHADIQRSRVAVPQLVGELIEDLRLRQQQAPLPEIALLDLPPADADPRLLRIVYTNLLTNACKFSAGREGARVELGSQQREGVAVYFVRDNGPGFDPAVAQRLFQPFQRLHGNRYAGHGVGLSIVRRAVERHGGRIWAEGRPEHGACFYFTLHPESAAAPR